MYQTTLNIKGSSPILLSCDRLANPIDKDAVRQKVLTNKQKKTYEDHLAIARGQWEGSLYWDDEAGVIIPTQNIRATIINGGKLSKLGMHLKRGLLCLDDFVPLEYGAKLTKDELWEGKYYDCRSVVIGKSRVMAYRPKFNPWSLTVNCIWDEKVIDEAQLIKSAVDAGKYVGLGGFRPEKGGMFGRFKVESFKSVRVKDED